MPRAAGPGRAKHFSQNWPLLLPGRRGGAGSFARNGRVPVRRRTRRFGHAALAPCSVFAPRRTTRRQRRALLGGHRRRGREEQAEAPTFRPRPGSTGTPPLVRIRTDTFLRREKCPRCRVRGCVSPGGRKRNDNAACGGAGPGEALFTKLAFAFARAARGCGQFCAKWPRPCPPPHARIRTLCPAAKVFASRRTTRRQCRVWLGFHRAAGGEKPARAPPCLAGLLIQARETPPSRGEARPSPRSAHRNGHFSLS